MSRRTMAGASVVLLAAVLLTVLPPAGRTVASAPSQTSPGDTSPSDTSLAQTSPAAQPSPATLVDMALTRVQAVVTDADDGIVIVARVHNPGPAPLIDLTGTLSVHTAVSSRLAYQRALDDPGIAPGGRVVADIDRPLTDLAAGDTRYLAFETAAAELGLTPGAAGQAVHPVRVAIRGRQGDGRSSTLAATTTALVVADPAPARPLRTAVLLPIDADLVRAGTHEASASHIEELAGVLAGNGVPVAVAIDNALAEESALRAADDLPVPVVSPAVRTLLADADVERLPTPYAEADLAALTRGGLVQLARREVVLGTRAWPGTDADATDILVPAAGIDAATVLQVIVPAGADTLVLDRSHLSVDEAAEPPTTPSPVRPLRVEQGSPDDPTDALTVMVPDPWLRAALDRRPALSPADVQRLLAETALLHLERPGGGEQRGFLLAPGDATALSPDGLGRLLAALSQAPWTDMTNVRNLPDEVAPGAPAALAYDGEAVAAELPASYIADVGAAQETLNAIGRLLGPDEPELATLRDNVLRAASTDFRGDLDIGRELLAAVVTTGAELLAAVRVVGRPTITFTDAMGQLPVVLRNTADVPLTVRVHLSSSRLLFPGNNRDVRLEPGTTTTVLFDAEARTPGGTAPVDVLVTDPGETTDIATGTVVVRIAAYPTLALLLIAGAVVAIGLWWMRDIRIRRRARRDAGAQGTATPVDAA